MSVCKCIYEMVWYARAPIDRILFLKNILDGAPAHTTNRNMEYLDTLFLGRVILYKSIRGQQWPPRSPDLNPCDYFLWGYLKEIFN